MTAGEILARAQAAGVRLSVDNSGRILASPRVAVTDDLREFIRSHKAALLLALRATPPTRSATASATNSLSATPYKGEVADVAHVALIEPDRREAGSRHPSSAATSRLGDRRQRVLALLAERPDIDVAMVCDCEGDPVPVVVAIRDRGLCEIHIPAAAFDPFALLELVGRHGGASIH
jgi:hypothetical protein